MALLLVTALLATVGAISGAPAPAGAATVTTQAALTLNCTATPPIVAPIAVTQELTVDIEHPDELPRNEIETVVISQPPLVVPTDLDGNTVINLNSIEARFRISPQFRIEAIRTVGGTTAANVTSTPTGDITLTVPGPLLGGQTYTIPTIEVDVKAVGTVGTSGTLSFVSFALVARASLPLIGAQNVPVNCPTPSPNPPLLTIGIAPGAFTTDPDPVITTTALDQQTIAKYGSTVVPVNPNLDSNPFNVTLTRLPDVRPGTDTTLDIDLGSKDWMDPYRGGGHNNSSCSFLGASGRQVLGVWDWSMTLNGPDTSRFQVLGVTTTNPSAMTATYNAGTNTILLARPAGAAGELDGPFSHPTVKLDVRAVGAEGQTATVSVASVRYQLRWRTCSFLGAGGAQTLTATTTAAAAVGGNPVGTQPNNTLFLRPFTSVALGSIGIAVPPTSNPDSVTVANNNPAGVAIDVLANDVAGTVPIDPTTVFIVDEPVYGTATVNPVTGIITYVPEFGTLEPEDGFTYVVQDIQGRYSNISSVLIDIVGLFCFGPCSLTQTIIVDVDPDTLTMEQAGGAVELDTVVLNGQPQWATAAMQEIRVVNERGGTAPWDITGQLTSDFKTDLTAPDCPASQPSTWYWKCVPGDNLGWEPLAAVAHQQVPGDVAVAEAGATISSGLRSAAQKLCGAPATESGGTFECGALVSLGVPASTGAGRYAATLTLTLA